MESVFKHEGDRLVMRCSTAEDPERVSGFDSGTSHLNLANRVIAAVYRRVTFNSGFGRLRFA